MLTETDKYYTLNLIDMIDKLIALIDLLVVCSSQTLDTIHTI